MSKRTANECYVEMCGTAEGRFTDEESEDQDLMNECDHLMFQCATCGWWCEAGDYCVPCCCERESDNLQHKEGSEMSQEVKVALSKMVFGGAYGPWMGVIEFIPDARGAMACFVHDKNRYGVKFIDFEKKEIRFMDEEVFKMDVIR